MTGDAGIPPALAGERLDRVVAMLTGRSRAEVAELVASGAVRVGGRPVTTRAHRLAEGDRVDLDLPPSEEPEALVPDPAVTVPIVHADDDVLVVDKPAGLVVHPGAGHQRSTLVQGLLARYPEVAGVGHPSRPGIVHRLDRGTSGLLVVARTPEAHADLSDQLAHRQVDRQYLALVWGHPEQRQGMVDAPIGRSRRSPTRMAVAAEGRAARTRYEVVATYHAPVPASLVRCRLETGRTHQIRVHLAAIGHPVVGDDRYGGQRAPVTTDRPWLHAVHLAFTHPASGARLAFDSDPPPDLEAIRATLS